MLAFFRFIYLITCPLPFHMSDHVLSLIFYRCIRLIKIIIMNFFLHYYYNEHNSRKIVAFTQMDAIKLEDAIIFKCRLNVDVVD